MYMLMFQWPLNKEIFEFLKSNGQHNDHYITNGAKKKKPYTTCALGAGIHVKEEAVHMFDKTFYH